MQQGAFITTGYEQLPLPRDPTPKQLMGRKQAEERRGLTLDTLPVKMLAQEGQ